jgi:phosphatidylserine/phosphatidylglycerophosphate/cardiolipin synthase-like enzyme
MYSFTNEDFANALVRAHERGVVVRVLVERQQAGSQYSQHGKLAAAGMVVRIDSNPNYMHDKFAVLDADTLINGSMNWTGNGVRENNENVMIVVSRELNEQFANEFQKIWDESDAYSIN